MKCDLSQKNNAIWESIYKDGTAGSNLKYPCEDLIIAVNRYVPGSGAKGKKLLAVGFGSGNNLEALAEKGFDCYGAEISASALEIAKRRLFGKGLHAELVQIEKNTYPFEDNFFDIIVAWNALCYNDEENLSKALAEIRRVLRPAGQLLATFPTFKDFAVTYGRKISESTFELIKKNSNQKGAIVSAAESKEHVKKLFGFFTDLEIGYSEISIKGITNSRWLIYGRSNKINHG